MLGFVLDKLDKYFDDFAYNGKHSLKHVLGKAGIKGGALVAAEQIVGKELGKEGVEAAARSASMTLGRTLAAETATEIPVMPVIGSALSKAGLKNITSQATFAIATPLAVGFGLWMEQEEYHHKQDMLLNRYRPEIAAWLDNGKRPEKLTKEDLELAAYGDPVHGKPGNPTLRVALQQIHLARNWNMGITSAAMTASTYTGALWEEPVKKSIEKITECLMSSASENPLLAIPELLAMGVIGYAVYLAVKTPLDFLAEKVFGVEKETIADKIQDLHRAHDDGHGITEAQIFNVYLAAHPQLDEQIRAAHGKHFARLPEEAQSAVLAEYGPPLCLAKLTEDINEGRVRVEELAFAVQSQSSGVENNSGTAMPPPTGLLSKVKRKCGEVLHDVIKPKEEAPVIQTAPAAPNYVEMHAATPDGNGQLAVQAYADGDAQNHVSYVQMVGHKRSKDGAMNYQEFVSQSRLVGTAELGA